MAEYDIPNRKARNNDNLSCDDGTDLTYENFGEEFFLNHCTACHSSDQTDADRLGAPDTINLDTPKNIQIFRANILEVTRAYFQDIDDGEEDSEQDSDGDGIPDNEEDSDGDGIPDVNEDENGNGIPDVIENGGSSGNTGEDDEVEAEPILMPPSGALPIPMLRNLKEYLNCGAPSGEDGLK